MAGVLVSRGAPAPDGRGTCNLSGTIEIPEEFLWGPLTNKVYHFDQYFPTKSFQIKSLDDGRFYRRMEVDVPGAAGETVEIIKVDKPTGVVEFVVVDPKTEQPTGEIRYNILHRDPLRIEYSTVNPDGVKTPLSDGKVVERQIKEAYDAWQQHLKAARD